MNKAIIVYIPVIHQGYKSFLDRHMPADIFLLTSKNLVSIDATIADRLSRDIRALSLGDVESILWDLYPEKKTGAFELTLHRTIESLDLDKFNEHKEYEEVIMLDEDISHVIEGLIPWAKVTYDNAFLRWDWSKTNAVSEVIGEFPVSTDQGDRQIMAMARAQAGGSSDVWRHVGAAIPINGQLLLAAHNEHMPDPHDPYINGDPRLNLRPGQSPEICTAIHAEQNIIAQAAKNGTAINGLSMYVTTFPCPVCARVIAKSGIKKVFFAEGYSTLDAAEILSKADIEIVQVK
jgi:dCMP deaminase